MRQGVFSLKPLVPVSNSVQVHHLPADETPPSHKTTDLLARSQSPQPHHDHQPAATLTTAGMNPLRREHCGPLVPPVGGRNAPSLSV